MHEIWKVIWWNHSESKGFRDQILEISQKNVESISELCPEPHRQDGLYHHFLIAAIYHTYGLEDQAV